MRSHQLLFFIVLVLCSAMSFGQDKLPNGEEVFQIVEDQPEFPGGMVEMYKFLSDTITYPLEARAQGISGMVYINFVITKTGTIEAVKVVKSVHPLLDEQAIKAVEAMPLWKPGEQRGKPVNVSYMIPVKFTLTEEDIIKAKEELNQTKGN